MNCNLGAVTPESSGFYFSWGNIEGHPKGSGYNFSQENYNTTPGASVESDLTTENDAAHAMLGNGAHIPSKIDVQELIDNCSVVWTSVNGVNGHLFTSNSNGKQLFIPSAGYYNGAQFVGSNTDGDFWTTDFYSASNAHYFGLYENNIVVDANASRRYGFSIRPVKESDPNRSIVPLTTLNEPTEEETPTTEEPKDENKR